MANGGASDARGLGFLLTAQGWPYLLVPFIAVAIALDLANASATAIFITAALGIIPTAALMGLATEELATRSGPGIGGLLNVTFGNFPELIAIPSKFEGVARRARGAAMYDEENGTI